MMCFLWQHDIYLWYLPGTACLYSGPPPVDLACLRNDLLHAWRCWYCGCHPQDTAVGRDRTHSEGIRSRVYQQSRMVSLAICAASWSVYDVLFLCLFVFFMRLVHFSRVLVWYVHTRRTLYEAKQGCGVVSCTTFSYWGACWSKVVVLIWYHMYVREDCYFWFFIEIFHFFSRYVGTW